MDEDSIKRYIVDTFADVDYVESEGNYYFFYNPDSPPDYMLPFTTLMTNDFNDKASDLDRPDIYRLNIGVSRATYQSLFGHHPDGTDVTGTVYDFSRLDQLMPHPVYAQQYWLCVLNPGPVIFETVKGLLAQAYQRAVDRRHKRNANDTEE